MKRWFAVQTHPRSEESALAHLKRQGFQAYLPRIWKERRHARRIERVRAPLFPRYLFVNLDLGSARWRAINSTIGVCALVSLGEAPTPVPDAVLDSIRAREGEDGIVAIRSTLYAPGTRVTVAEGPFQDLTGLFEAATDDNRVLVLLTLMQREVRVTLPRAVLVSA